MEEEVNGEIAITSSKGQTVSLSGFKYVGPPEIISISKKKLEEGDKLNIVGKNFTNDVDVSIDGIEQTVTILNDTEVELIVEGPVSKGLIKLKTPVGETSYGGSTPFDAAANITVPLQGQGINIIPTPTFNFTQIHGGDNFGFRLGLWGNMLGTDSTMEKVVSNLLVPQISLFGLRGEGLLRLTNLDQKNSVGLSFQLNLLLKKVSYYDTSSKDVSSFNPFVLHPKVGMTFNLFNNYVFIGSYLNLLSVAKENEKFETFFSTRKSTFIYPNFNLGGIFDFEGSKQSIKVELDLVVHNGETRMLFQTRDKVIPYLKIALLSDL
ncbi:IPT/TIG domain-containing protein [Niabella hibiscisoli]|uniref:IPT/TIG domain-containing protein n=1 Tax=Niabella hibiscisoli TaxID=1825928 RepID=UPI001F0F72ED|nr:IPT/TIG domain-containing protein [Niabella hibiscisoli]MCH5716674.1 IPT/TIG domain-containing protein [Niabella hibiscisoli]